MTARDQIVLIFLFFSVVLWGSAFITKMRGGLFIIDYNDLKDQSPNRENERRRGSMYADFIFRWLKYFVGFLLILFSNRFLKAAGGLLILFSLIFDKRSR